MRIDNLSHGITVVDIETEKPLQDAKGTVLTSTTAGWRALWLTFLQRCTTVHWTLFSTSFVMTCYGLSPIASKSRLARGAIEVALVYAGLSLSVPVSMGVFPREAYMSTQMLEEKFHCFVNSDGSPKMVKFYRGE